MIELSEISKVGLGTYRMSVSNSQHINAGRLAFQYGCNLVDTSSIYCGGNSERLIALLEKERKNIKLFVITKFGYILNKEFSHLSKGIKKNNIFIKISDDAYYSIDPSFIIQQLESSLLRLEKKQIDGYLLHNPEYLLKQGGFTKNDFYEKIYRVFSYLEEEVKRGRVRYYGISSNNFAFKPNHPFSIDIREVIRVAESIDKNHHFRLVQFPYNAIENQAIEKHFNGSSLIELCQSKSLVTMINRPLNAYTVGNENVRLCKSNSWKEEYEEIDMDAFNKIINLVDNRLIKIGFSEGTKDLPLFNMLHDNWNCLSDSRSVDKIFSEHLIPLLEAIFDGQIDNSNQNIDVSGIRIVRDFYKSCTMSTVKLSENKHIIIADQLAKAEIIDSYSSKDISTQLFENYLSNGINHILSGMVDPFYVKLMKSFF